MRELTRVTEKAYRTCRVIAGPLGFYGCAYGVVLGPRCGSIDEAWEQVEVAAPLIESAGATGAIHAWRMIN